MTTINDCHFPSGPSLADHYRELAQVAAGCTARVELGTGDTIEGTVTRRIIGAFSIKTRGGTVAVLDVSVRRISVGAAR